TIVGFIARCASFRDFRTMTLSRVAPDELPNQTLNPARYDRANAAPRIAYRLPCDAIAARHRGRAKPQDLHHWLKRRQPPLACSIAAGAAIDFPMVSLPASRDAM